MRRTGLIVAGGIALAALLTYGPRRSRVTYAQSGAPAARTAVRITFGELQERASDYTGTIEVSPGTVAEIIPWRFFGDDQIRGTNGWKITTRRANFENQPDKPVPIATPGQMQNVVPKGVTAVLDAKRRRTSRCGRRGGIIRSAWP